MISPPISEADIGRYFRTRGNGVARMTSFDEGDCYSVAAEIVRRSGTAPGAVGYALTVGEEVTTMTDGTYEEGAVDCDDLVERLPLDYEPSAHPAAAPPTEYRNPLWTRNGPQCVYKTFKIVPVDNGGGEEFEIRGYRSMGDYNIVASFEETLHAEAFLRDLGIIP